MAYTPKLTYKGRPLVRCGNDIYYGSMSDPYIVYLQVLSNRTENGVEIADKVHLVLLSTDDSKPLPERIVRQANKVGLYNALSFGDIMLQGALQHDVAEGEGVVQPYFVGLTDDALGQGFGIVGGEQHQMHLVGDLHAVLGTVAQHLQVDDVRVAHGAVVNVIAAAHQRAAFIGQFRGVCHSQKPSFARFYVSLYHRRALITNPICPAPLFHGQGPPAR